MRAPGETLLNYKDTNMHRLQTHHLEQLMGEKLPQQPEGNQWRLRSGAPIGQRQPAASAYAATQHMITPNTAGFLQHGGGTGKASG